MSALAMVVSGCFIVFLGILTLNGWRAAEYRNPLVAGGGGVAMGSGFVVDGLPRLLHWSSGAGFALATVGFVLIGLGAVAQVLARPVSRGRRGESNG
jgi:hypothetical protein